MIKRNQLIHILTSVLLLIAFSNSFAQKGAIVVNDLEGNPLEGVYVRDLNNEDLVGVTDGGKFVIKNTEFSTDILLQRYGYEDLYVDVQLTQPNIVSMRRVGFPEGYIYLNTFDEIESGFRTDQYEVRGNFDTKTENGITSSTSGSNQTRMFIDQDLDAFDNGKSLRVYYPRGKIDSKESGAQWRGNLHGEYTELYVSYWVRFEEDFTFTLGGKLPGLAGSEDYDENDREFSGKLMWRENGKVEFYLHPTSNGEDDGTSDVGKIRGWWDEVGQVKLRKDRWEYIEIYYKLNTPGLSDGIMMGWVNNELRGIRTEVAFRGVDEDDVKLNQLFFSTFFGGNETYAPESGLYAWYDDFRVSESRIGNTHRVITSVNSGIDSEELRFVTKTGDNSYQLKGDSEWLLIDLLGNTVKVGNSSTLDVSDLSSGQYFLKHKLGTYKLAKN